MYAAMTWKNPKGDVETRASKAVLTARLYTLERFLSLYESSRWCLDQYKEYALLIRSGKLSPEGKDYLSHYLPSSKERYHQSLKRLDSAYRRLMGTMTTSTDAEASALERNISAEQMDRLLTVLRDNGIEADEVETVAEAICFVLDMSRLKEEPYA